MRYSPLFIQCQAVSVQANFVKILLMNWLVDKYYLICDVKQFDWKSLSCFVIIENWGHSSNPIWQLKEIKGEVNWNRAWMK